MHATLMLHLAKPLKLDGFDAESLTSIMPLLEKGIFEQVTYNHIGSCRDLLNSKSN